MSSGLTPCFCWQVKRTVRNQLFSGHDICIWRSWKGSLWRSSDSDQTSTLSFYSQDLQPHRCRLLETIRSTHIKSSSLFISVTTGSSGLSGQCSSLFGSIYPTLVPSPATYMFNNLSTCFIVLFRTHQHPPYYIDCLLFCLVSFKTKENLSFMRWEMYVYFVQGHISITWNNARHMVSIQ